MQRRLAAILSADVAGYSALMETDEAGTLKRLKRNRARIFDPCVAAHGGRVVKLIGDGALVEFPSVVAAVNCALEIQEQTAAAADEDGDPEIRHRIGINLGDVIVDGDDIYGDGVNVAARVQALAPVGGIAVAATVRDHVAGKVPYAFEDLGEHTVKNIERPVRIYVLRSPGPAPIGNRQVEPERGAAICVLPFANMSGDPEQEYFSDGISEDIITDLSKVSALWVAARNTAFTFKGKHVDAAQIARQLKVSHLLEGSVRKAGGRVRITAQLIDGARRARCGSTTRGRAMGGSPRPNARSRSTRISRKPMPARALVLTRDGAHDEARREFEIALDLDPESYDANRAAGSWYYSMRRPGEAIPYYAKAATVMESDYMTAGHDHQLLQGHR